VKATAEAGVSARRKATFLSAAAEPAEGVGTNAALTVRLGIAASGLAVSAERLWCSFRAFVNTARATAVAAGRLRCSFCTVVNTACALTSIESVAVIKRPAS
jgi:hypothetical protein